MFRVELSKQVRRWRTWLLAAALAGIPVLVVVAVRLSPPPPQNSQDAPPFLLQIVRNGLFAPLTGLALVQPFFKPYVREPLPVSERLWQQIVTLPLFYDMTEADIRTVIDAVVEFDRLREK